VIVNSVSLPVARVAQKAGTAAYPHGCHIVEAVRLQDNPGNHCAIVGPASVAGNVIVFTPEDVDTELLQSLGGSEYERMPVALDSESCPKLASYLA
jgi:hypothetical protein